MSVNAALAGALRTRIGVTERKGLGVLTELMIQRYARAIGDDNPLYHDAGEARVAGLPGVLAPPNLIPSIVSWAEGAGYDGLRADGTEAGENLSGVPDSGVRVMGGGEEMEFHAPAHAGMELELETRLESVEERNGKTGPMLVLRYRNHFTDTGGNPVVTAHRTVLLR